MVTVCVHCRRFWFTISGLQFSFSISFVCGSLMVFWIFIVICSFFFLHWNDQICLILTCGKNIAAQFERVGVQALKQLVSSVQLTPLSLPFFEAFHCIRGATIFLSSFSSFAQIIFELDDSLKGKKSKEMVARKCNWFFYILAYKWQINALQNWIRKKWSSEIICRHRPPIELKFWYYFPFCARLMFPLLFQLKNLTWTIPLVCTPASYILYVFNAPQWPQSISLIHKWCARFTMSEKNRWYEHT